MSGCIKVKISDLFSSLWINDAWCKWRLERINGLLTELALLTYDLPINKVAQRIDGSCDEVQLKLNAIHVWGIWWFWCNLKCSIVDTSCCSDAKLLLLDLWVVPLVKPYTYAVQCWKVSYKIPWLEHGYVVYSKGFDEILDFHQEIELDPDMYVLLRYYLPLRYSLYMRADANSASVYKNSFNWMLDTIRKKQDNSLKYMHPWSMVNKRI